jgi:RHS repeat-associated protein
VGHDGPYSQGYDFDAWGNVTRRYGWGGEVQGGSAGNNGPDVNRPATNNKVNGFSYDAAGNVTNDLGQTFSYDATGQQATAAYGGYSLQQSYDGNGLRVKKTENGAITYYLRSSVLSGQVVAELNSGGVLQRNYVYLGGQLLTLKQSSNYYWVHEDPITKSKRVTDASGAVVSKIELDPWGATISAPFSSNDAFQPKKFTSYERDGNGSDEAMFRRFNRWHSRFDQPDPYNGAYNAADPQSLNRYAYVQGDPVNFVDPSGLHAYWRENEGDPVAASMGAGAAFSGASGIFGVVGFTYVDDHIVFSSIYLLFMPTGGGGRLGGAGGGGQQSVIAPKRKSWADAENDCYGTALREHNERTAIIESRVERENPLLPTAKELIEVGGAAGLTKVFTKVTLGATGLGAAISIVAIIGVNKAYREQAMLNAMKPEKIQFAEAWQKCVNKFGRNKSWDRSANIYWATRIG